MKAEKAGTYKNEKRKKMEGNKGVLAGYCSPFILAWFLPEIWPTLGFLLRRHQGLPR
jgi:hypothetical protein